MRALVLAALLTATGASAGEIGYTVTDIGTLGGAYIYVSGINSSGQVVGNSTTNGAYFMHAFVYGVGALQDLGTLGGTNSYGYAINDSGQVAGGAYNSAGKEDAFLYSTGEMADLGTLGGTGSDARAINSTGQVAGGSWISGNTEYHAYLYSGGVKTDLGTLGGTRSGAFGINDNGDVVGRSSLSGIAPQHAFLYHKGTMTDLGTLGGTESWAFAINNAGLVVGEADTVTNTEHAFLYSNGAMTDLGTLGGLQSRAYAINNHDQAVGFASTTDGWEHAFLWSPGGGMIDLNSLIDTNSGWILEIGTAINDSGQIAGIGNHPSGQLRAFLLTPVLKLQISLTSSNSTQLQFTAQPNSGYVIESRDSLSAGTWQAIVVLDPAPTVHEVVFTDPASPAAGMRFYRVRGSGGGMFKSASGTLTHDSVLLPPHAPEATAIPELLLQSFVIENRLMSAAPHAPGVALSAEEAAARARRLANDQAERLYNLRPFQRNSPARWTGGRWLWRERQGYGHADFEAEVQFSADGGGSVVNVILIESQLETRL